MWKGIAISIIILLLLLTLPMQESNSKIILPKSKVRITNIETVNEVNAGDEFVVNITVQNDRIYQVTVFVEIDLLDKILGTKKKALNKIVEQKQIPRGTSDTIRLACVIQEEDIEDCWKEQIIQAVLFEKKILKWRAADDIATGIEVKTKLNEKEKVRIEDFIVSNDFLEENETDFSVFVDVINDGSYDFTSWIRIDFVERAFLGPLIEPLEDLKFFELERKELNRSADITLDANGGWNNSKINCHIPKVDQEKKRFHIQALIFVKIDGIDYQVDSSTMIGIYHDQPAPDEFYFLIIGAIAGIILTMIIIIVGIRILYPIYYVKRIELKEKKKQFDRKEKWKKYHQK